MKVLICSKYKHHDKWPGIKEILEKGGHQCTTPMDIDIKLFGKSGLELDQKQYLVAVRYYYDLLKEADVLYVLNFDGMVGKSMMQEIGYASALKKDIYSLEETTNEPSLKLFVKAILSPVEVTALVNPEL